MTRPVLILDGVTLPPLVKGGLQVTAEKIWSQNAGRSTSTGEFTGDLIAVKYTVTLQFMRLTEEQFRTVWGIVSGLTPFHSLTFPLPQPGGINTRTIRCYSVSPTGTMQQWMEEDGTACYDGFAIECIGK